jgi:hypothetical protein
MLANFLNQLRDNPRLRWGVLMIIGIFWLYGVLVLRDDLQEQTLQQRTVVQSIARLRVQLTQTQWMARLTPAKVLSVQLEGKLWQAPTSGLAQAAFQDWLNATLLKAAIANPQISVTVVDDALSGPNTNSAASASGPNPDPGAVANTPTDLWKIKAKVNFELGTAVASDVMARIESHEKQIVVGALNIRKEPSPRLEMELFAFFQKPSVSNPSSTAPAVAPNKPPVLP